MMKCKECREKIPDNVKYCPECGALINNIKYDPFSLKNNDFTIRQTNYAPQQSQPMQKKNRKKGANDTRKLIAISFVIFIVFAGFVTSSIFNKTEPEFISIENDACDDAAIDYIDNFFDSEYRRSYDDFNYRTTIDWDILIADLYLNSNLEDHSFDKYEDGYLLASEAFENFCKQSCNKLLPGDLNDYYIQYEVTDTSVLSNDDFYSYIDVINYHLESYGLSALDYIDYSAINEILEVQISMYLYDSSDNTILYTEPFFLILAETDGFYDVLYDYDFIEDFLSSVTAENEAHTDQIQ